MSHAGGISPVPLFRNTASKCTLWRGAGGLREISVQDVLAGRRVGRDRHLMALAVARERRKAL
jgi:hypothetical protein